MTTTVATPRITRVTPETLAQMIALYEAGQSTYDLAARFGISAPTVSIRLRQAGVTMRASAPKKGVREARQADANYTDRQCRRCTIRIARPVNLTGLIVESVESPDPALCRMCYRKVAQQELRP